MIPTWRKLRLMIDGSGLAMDRFWFTNYCHGVINSPQESYNFPASVIKVLEFSRIFEECVRIMQPSLIVSLGLLPAKHLGTDFASRENIERRTILGHPTCLLAAVHPSAWTWQGKGFSDGDFRAEGARIGSAAQGGDI